MKTETLNVNKQELNFATCRQAYKTLLSTLVFIEIIDWHWNWHFCSIRKLSVSILFTSDTFFLTVLMKHICEIKSRRLRLQILTYFKKPKKHGFIQACNSSEKVLIVEEELDAIDIHEHKKLRGFT